MGNRVAFTSKRIRDFVPTGGKDQEFLWDAKVRGLAVRCSPAGQSSFIFQGRYQRQTIRLTIGKLHDWSIPLAREKAHEIQRLIDQGQDPRLVFNGEKIAAKAERKRQRDHSITVGELWADYLNDRKSGWAEVTHHDHLKAMKPGGDPHRRWKGKKTRPGALAPLRNVCIGDLTQEVIEKVVMSELKNRPTQTRLALRMFRAFLGWTAEEKKLRVTPELARSRKLLRMVGSSKPKSDHLLKNQLQIWFSHVQKCGNSVIAAYLQCLLLTGARRSELLKLKWSDIDWKWLSLTINDKVDGVRTLPLTPYVASLISGLPRINEWVFSSKTSKSGHLVEPSIAHRAACVEAELSLTLHGLRRSFKSLTEWQEIPAGVVAQIMGHKPTATAEKHYTVRPIDLLRIHHKKIETWILQEANIQFDPASEVAILRVVSEERSAR